jgi:hypothetical protein
VPTSSRRSLLESSSASLPLNRFVNAHTRVGILEGDESLGVTKNDLEKMAYEHGGDLSVSPWQWS